MAFLLHLSVSPQSSASSSTYDNIVEGFRESSTPSLPIIETLRDRPDKRAPLSRETADPSYGTLKRAAVDR